MSAGMSAGSANARDPGGGASHRSSGQRASSRSSRRGRFFALRRFAIVGDTDGLPFPRQAHATLRGLGRVVYPVDLGGARYVGGDEAFGSVAELPGPVDAAVLALPRRRLPSIVLELAARGVRHLWIEEGQSPEALELCRRHDLEVWTGRCDPQSLVERLRRGLARLFGRSG